MPGGYENVTPPGILEIRVLRNRNDELLAALKTAAHSLKQVRREFEAGNVPEALLALGWAQDDIDAAIKEAE